jgi:hypothetical protein
VWWVAGAPEGAAAGGADEEVDAAVSHRPDAALLAVAGQEHGASFDTVCALAQIQAVGVGAREIGRWGRLDIDLAHR